MSNRETVQQLDMFTATATFSQAEIDRAIRLGRLIQAATLATVIVAAGAAVVRGVRKAVQAVRLRRERARACAELSAMSNRELADIGLARSDIAAIAAGIDPLAERRALVAALATSAKEGDAALPLVAAARPAAGNDSRQLAA